MKWFSVVITQFPSLLLCTETIQSCLIYFVVARFCFVFHEFIYLP